MMLDWLLSALATWRLSSLLVNEDGPAHVFKRLRVWAELHSGFLADLLACVWCCSVWVAAIMPFMPRPVRQWLALSAAAILIEEALREKPSE